MKMANIDWACDFMFTDPKYSDGVCALLIRDIYLFMLIILILVMYANKS